MSSSPLDLPALMALVTQAVSNQQLSATAAENIHGWLSEERYAAYASLVIEHINNNQWQELDDA